MNRMLVIRMMAAPLSAALVLVATARVQAADDPKDIIIRAIKAHGGEEFLTKYKAASTRSQGKLNVSGIGETDFTQESTYMIPDKFKESVELSVAGQKIRLLTIVVGDTITIEVNGMDVPVPDAAKTALKGVGALLKVSRLVPLVKEKGYELNLIGEDTVEGRKVVGVRISKKGQNDVSMYFDQQTGLLAKLEFRGADPSTGMELNEERIVLEYAKNKDGIPVPRKVLIKHDGKKYLEAEVLETNYYEKLDDSEFKK
jgi:hypothetical protein